MGLGQLVEALAVQVVDGEHVAAPLLQQLRKAVWGDIGRTVSGAGGQGVPINLGAFTVWENLAGQIEAQFHGATEIRPNRSPVVNVLAWYAVFAAAEARGDVDELQVEVATERLQGWVNEIRKQLTPPRVLELLIDCPVCGNGRVTLGEGESEVEAAAIVVELRDPLRAECRACDATWEGDVEVIRLAKAAKVKLDVEAIRESKRPTVDEEPPPPGRVIEDFDPRNADHVALLRQRAG